LSQPVEGAQYLEARLAGYADGMVKVQCRNRELTLPFMAIRKANLVVEI
jgi:ribosome maturation factor RimP